MESNPQLKNLPSHLKQFIRDQDYSSYSAIDQAVWRYVMRINVSYLSTVAHESYLEGLKITGLEIENIAQMYGMNRILQEIGWAAVAVDGFIPPSAFMEFQAYNVLVIASDIRQLKHIQYTPAPDIIHEAAGHAPIIANKEYAEYLRYFGEIGSKALGSAKDYELYEAIRHLSIIKEYPFTPQDSIIEAEKEIEKIQASMGEPSEMALIRRLHWWTVEYGLIGSLKDPRIYGAGLLSSIGESSSCMNSDVRKIPYTIDAMNMEFDITKPQPQLFVTPSFIHLTKVLDQFADTMALRTGGSYAVEKAIKSGNVATAVLSSGLQISGKFDTLVDGTNGQPIYFGSHSASALAFANKQLPEHSKSNYRQGFLTLIGAFGGHKAPELLNDQDLHELGIISGEQVDLQWEFGFRLKGTVVSWDRSIEGKLLLIKFRDVAITRNEEQTFRDSIFNLAVAGKVVSVFSGAADRPAFSDIQKIPAEHTYKVIHDAETKRLQRLYQEVRDIRHSGKSYVKLIGIFDKITSAFPEDWLLSVEIYELLAANPDFRQQADRIKKYLKKMIHTLPQYKRLIEDGLQLIDNETPVLS